MAPPKGTVIILTSTVGIAATKPVIVQLEKNGVGLVGVPVSSRPIRVGEGDPLVACGTLPRDSGKVREVPEAMTGRLALVGDESGEDQVLRTVSQLLYDVYIAVAGETPVLAGKLELD